MSLGHRPSIGVRGEESLEGNAGRRTQATPKRNRLPLPVTSSGHTQCHVTQCRKSCFPEEKMYILA